MSPLPWMEVKQTFNRLLEMPPEDRAAELCRLEEHPQLLREVRSLLDAHREATDEFIAEPLVGSDVDLLEKLSDSWVAGRTFGPYRALRELGRGGMGVVYLAERIDGRRQETVALKLIQPGLSSREILRRFLAERMTLASLNHPGIARLIDGGMAEGSIPYFAMEYVEGRPIDDYCDAHRLTLGQRIDLFLEVCEVVAYLHGRSIVHRDLKRGNILVTEGGKPKVLDLGIAKLLPNPEGAAEVTRTALRVLTPECASPEHLVGDPITAASDVYALGILLYRLLTGDSPYDADLSKKSEVIEAIFLKEPVAAAQRVQEGRKASFETLAELRGTSPATLLDLLERGFDEIFDLALAKAPEDRYPNVMKLEAALHALRRTLDT